MLELPAEVVIEAPIEPIVALVPGLLVAAQFDAEVSGISALGKAL